MKIIIEKARGSIRSFPVVTFFILSIILMFGFLFPAIFLVPHDTTYGQMTGYYISMLAVYSPAIAGVFVSKIVNHPDKSKSIKGKSLILFLFWVVAMIIQLTNLKLTAPSGASMVGLFLLEVPVSLLPLWLILSALKGSKEVRKLLHTLVRPGGGFIYYLIALFTFPVIHIAGSAITNVIKGQALFPDLGNIIKLFYTVFITFLSVLLYSGGLNEETGWRGFAQKRMQSKFNPLMVALILWILMVIWHIPNDLLQYQNGGYLTVRILLYPFITIIFCWIYNRTNGNILPVAIFHASMNSMNPLMGLFPITLAGNIMIIILALGVVIKDKMWRKLPYGHFAVYK